MKLPRDRITLLILYISFIYRKQPGVSTKLHVQKYQEGSYCGVLNPMTLVKHKLNIQFLLWLE